VLRINDMSDALLPKSFGTKLDSLAVYSRWSKALVAQKSVTYIWNKEEAIETTQRRLPEMRKKYGMSK